MEAFFTSEALYSTCRTRNKFYCHTKQARSHEEPATRFIKNPSSSFRLTEVEEGPAPVEPSQMRHPSASGFEALRFSAGDDSVERDGEHGWLHAALHRGTPRARARRLRLLGRQVQQEGESYPIEQQSHSIKIRVGGGVQNQRLLGPCFNWAH